MGTMWSKIPYNKVARWDSYDTTKTSGPRYPPQLSKGSWRKLSEKKNICYKLRFQVALSQSIPRLFVLSLFLRMRVNNWNWKWNKKKSTSCIRKIHKEKNQLKCQNRTWKLMAIPGVWRKSMLLVYGCVFCSISLLSVYMCAYTLKIKVHCRSTFEPGASALPSAHHLHVLIDGSVGTTKKNGNFGDIEEKSNLTKLKVCDKDFRQPIWFPPRVPIFSMVLFLKSSAISFGRQLHLTHGSRHRDRDLPRDCVA